ncbi:MAG: hypothetical protein Q9227_004583 [Pyrenula ochraceoflavens]
MDSLKAWLLSREEVSSNNLDVERQAVSQSQFSGSHQPSATRPIAFLDGLRGVAAGIVYFYHHISWYYGADDQIHHGFGFQGAAQFFATLPVVRVFFTGGSAAVAVFFVLSGYVLSRSPLRMLRDGESCYMSLFAATLRRPLRLFLPPAGISLVVALALHLPCAPLLAWPPPKDNIFAEILSWALELCKALNPLTDHGPFTPWFPYDPPIWTMPIEFKGSILVFILIALSSLTKRRILLFGVLWLLLFALYEWAMACFVAGMILAANDLEQVDMSFLKGVSSRTKSIAFHSVFVIGLYLLGQPAGTKVPERSYLTPGWYVLTMITPSNYFNSEYWRFWNSIGAVMLVYSVLKIGWLQRGLASLKYLGKISFSLYLTHIPFLWIVGDRIYRFFGFVRPESEFTSWFDHRLTVPDSGPHGLSTRFLMTQSIMLPLNVAIAHYGTMVFDEPSVGAGKWLSSKITATVP